MNSGQLIEYNMRNIFLEKSYTKCGRETILRAFLKSQNWAYLGINNLRFYTVCFHCMPIWGLLKYIETKLLTTWFYFIESLFKSKKKSRSSLTGWFLAWFLKKNNFLVISYKLTKFHFLVAIASWDIGKYV